MYDFLSILLNSQYPDGMLHQTPGYTKRTCL